MDLETINLSSVWFGVGCNIGWVTSRIQIGKVDMASHAWPDGNSGKSGIIAYLSCSSNNQFWNYDFTNFFINIIVFDEKANKTLNLEIFLWQFGFIALELVVRYGKHGKNYFSYLYVFKFRTILASQRWNLRKNPGKYAFWKKCLLFFQGVGGFLKPYVRNFRGW